jgi:hypothetical protein
LAEEKIMDEKKVCTAEEKRKKTVDHGEWFFLQRMKSYHARFRQEYDDHRDYFSNLALHESYEEEHVVEKLCKKCTRQECLIEKRRAELRKQN